MSYYTRQSLILVLSNAVWWAITPITQSCFTIKASVQKLSFVRVTVWLRAHTHTELSVFLNYVQLIQFTPVGIQSRFRHMVMQAGDI